ALVVEITLRLKHSPAMGVNDFPPAFLFVALLAASAALIFMRLPHDAGAELSGRLETGADATGKARQA
ncbi:MAG TPA: MFS transporter, partial [Xanthobacteraceae bacterium]|nr:MFS transporter [Xanthobacteraceae bacterium]